MKMSYEQWKFSWIRDRFVVPSHVALASLMKNGEMKVLIRLRGTQQKFFYTIYRFDQGIRTEETRRYPSLEAAMAAA
jgi:hypothetical protein